MFDMTSSAFQTVLFAVAFLTIVLHKIGTVKGIPVFVLVSRWLRWVLLRAYFPTF